MCLMKMNSGNKSSSLSRRVLLKTLGTTGSAAALGTGVTGGSVAARTESSNRLGSFDSSLDDWKTNGGNTLKRVSKNNFGAVVTSGDHAMGVGIDGDPYPMVWRNDLGPVDFASNPYFVAEVYATTLDNDADVVFDLRLHYNPKGPGNGNENRGKEAGKGGKRGTDNSPVGKPRVVSSDPITVPQNTPQHLTWDMRDLPDETLTNARRFEIAWHPANHEPRKGPNGRGPGYDYQGAVFLDSIRLESSQDVLASQRLTGTLSALEREYGSFKRVVTESADGGVETGYVEFLSGATVDYTFEILSDEQYRYTIAGETFDIGGGWA